MSHHVHKFDPGECVCLIGDPVTGAVPVNVLRMSGLEAVLDPSSGLMQDQFIYVTVKMRDGPSVSLTGLVVTTAAGGILVQWNHSNPQEADDLDRIIRAHLAEVEKRDALDGVEGSLRHSMDPSRKEAASRKEPASQKDPAARKDPASQKEPDSRKESASRKETATRTAAAADSVDVQAKLLQKAKIVNSADLATRVKTVQVVDMTTIKTLIRESVDETMTLLGSNLAEHERRRLLEEAEAGFNERLKIFKSEKEGLEEKTRLLAASLEKAQALLKEERGKVVRASQFTVSDAGMVELEQRLGRLLDRAVTSGGLSNELQDDMRKVVLKLLDDEREKIRAQAQEAQNDKIALLERKVERLASNLESAEHERDKAQRRAQALEASGGVGLRNIMEAGLDDDDPQLARKLDLLKEIYAFNQEIRTQLAEEGRLPKPRAVAQAPSPAAADAPPSDAGAREEEAKIASELGIQRAAPPASEASGTADPPAQDVAQQPAEMQRLPEEDTEAIPVLASGPGADPDDMPWEPKEDAAAEAKPVAIKRLGKDSGQGAKRTKRESKKDSKKDSKR